MPIFINDEKTSIEEIRAYKGEDKVMNMLRQNLSYLERRMSPSMGEYQSIKFKWSKHTRRRNKLSGRMEGKKGVFVPLRTTINTPQGTKVVVYCETAIPKPMGGYDFRPRGYWFRGTKVYTLDDLEFLLWNTTFCSSIRMELEHGEIVNEKAPISIEDIGLENRRLATQRQEQASLHAYIYSDLSPMTDNQIRTMATAWGIPNVGAKSLEHVKNALYDRVMIAEGNKDKKYDIKAFISAAQNDNDFFNKMILIQRSLDQGIIMFDKMNNRWIFVGEKGEDIEHIVSVPATELRRKREFLADHLVVYQRKAELMQVTLDHKLKKDNEEYADVKWVNENEPEAKAEPEKPGRSNRMTSLGGTKTELTEDSLLKKTPGSPLYDESTDFDSLHWNALKEAAEEKGIKVFRKKKEDVLAEVKAAYGQ